MNVKMSDLIDREKAIEKMSLYGSAWMKVVKQLPPIQPEIIRCKDCKHRDKYGCCTHWKGLAMDGIPIATDDNDFCSRAEKREVEDAEAKI